MIEAIDEFGHPVDLAALEPGEAFVRCMRGTLRFPRHVSAPTAGPEIIGNGSGPFINRRALTKSQRACLEGDDKI